MQEQILIKGSFLIGEKIYGNLLCRNNIYKINCINIAIFKKIFNEL